MMKTKLVITSVLLGTLVPLFAVEMPNIYVLASRKDAVYKTGEEIEFKVTAGRNDDLQYSINTGKQDSPRQKLEGSSIRVKAENPGFVLVKLFYKDAAGKQKTALGGAAVEPEKIRAGRPRPADFDAYWDGQLAELNRNPLKVVYEKEVQVPKQPKGIRLYDVKLTQGDIVATGYLAVPENAAAKSLPGVVSYLGASKVSAEPPSAWNPARSIPAICFNLNFHGLQNLPARNYPKEKELRKQLSRDYRIDFADQREKYAMRKIYLRTVMALNYLQSRPEYDGKHLVAQGGSLGGCQAIVAAALVPQVTFCVSTAAAMCGHFGAEAGHLPGYPNLLRRNPKAAGTAGYFDVVNFAPRIKCPVVMAVGFIDVTCPPASTYAAYNALTTDKRKMIHQPTCGHGSSIFPGKANIFSCGAIDYINHCRGK